MSYIALYRKFRPLSFSDMVGQDHISEILKNQVINDRVGHAYLFSGIRGTGKTTSAKIFSRAINCLNSKNGEPCNECEICKSILDDSLTDVTEIDAASNNSVDNIRNIREEVMYAPTKAKYRIYIIDEVHMLSTGAFNALLKTLEEPPKHVKFILATTEPTKIPATILSRCQRFDFKRISNKDIIYRLREILKNINKSADEAALNIIADLSEGAMRDAISILDRCVADQENITVEYVAGLVGIPNRIKILEVLDNISKNDASNAIIQVNEILDNGQNAIVFLDEIIKMCMEILVYSKTQETKVYNQNEKEKIVELSKNMSNEKITNVISELSKMQNEAKWSNTPNILVQAGIVKLCIETRNDGLDDLKKRIEKLESEDRVVAVAKNKLGPTSVNNIAEQQIKKTEDSSRENTVKTNITIKGDVIAEWKEILTNLRENGKVQLFTNLVTATAKKIEENTIGIFFKAAFAKGMVEKPENIQIIQGAVDSVLGKKYEIRCFLECEEKKEKFSDIESKAKEMNIPIDILDE